jgi:hypothetical protein
MSFDCYIDCECTCHDSSPDTSFRDKIAEMLGCFVQNGKDYLILYKLEDVLKESRALKEENAKLKGVAVESVKVASERTPDDRNCGSEG